MGTVFDPWLAASAYAGALAGAWEPAPLRAAQQRVRLAELLHRAARGSRLVREMLGRTPPQRVRLQDLPRTGKRMLMQRFGDWVADPALELAALRAFLADPRRIADAYLGRYLAWESSGSSGEPGVFVQDAQSLAVFDALEMLRGPGAWRPGAPGGMGWRADDRLAFVGATGGHYASIVSLQRMRRLQPLLAPRIECLSFLDEASRLAGCLQDFAPTLLAAYPSVAWMLAQQQKAGALALHLRGVWTGGETLGEAMRADIAQAFGCPVHDSYGASEFFSIASPCAAGRLHVNDDWVILEPVDADGLPVPPGEPSHTTLLTNLANAVQPLIRYDLGDGVALSAGRCPCGSLLPVVQVRGRCDDVLSLRAEDGRDVALSPLALTTVLEDEGGVFDFQLVQRGPASLRLRLDGADGNAAACAQARAALDAYLARCGLGRVRLEVRPGRSSPAGRSGKRQRVVARAGPERARG